MKESTTSAGMSKKKKDAMITKALNAVDKIEILVLQDNYIEMTAMDDNEIISRGLRQKEN